MNECLKRKVSKYINNNVLVSTNEFMQLFMLNVGNYKQPIFNSNEIIFLAEKEIDNKAKIRLSWDLIQTYSDPKIQQILLKEKEKTLLNKNVREKIHEFSLFSREEIIMYLILFNHYVENKDYLDENKNIVITLKDIHCKYRNKTLKMYSKIDKDTEQSYYKAIFALKRKKVTLDVDSCKKEIPYIKRKDIASFSDYLLNCIPISDETSKKLVALKYNLGKFGEFLLTSKRITSDFPVELLEKPYKQIGQVFIGLYISKIIFINRKRKLADNIITMSIPAILRNIIHYNVKGENIGQTLLEKLNSTNQKYATIKTFEKNLTEVLELYKKHGFIKNYTIDNICVANYKLKSTKLKLFVR